MGWKVKILDVVLTVVQFFVKLVPINAHKIAFVSLESKNLESDLKLIYEAVEKKGTYQVATVLTDYHKNSIWMDFCYFLNTIKQLAVINTSALVILNDNNYVVSRFKRPGVKVLQVWHAAGAIKKFGNAIPRQYAIRQYDYVLCNGEYWKQPYSLAFHVSVSQVIGTGMPRLDHLLDQRFLSAASDRLFTKYPQLKAKQILLYAPTFRGDIYVGMKIVELDLQAILAQLEDDYVILYKLHPLLRREGYPVSDRIMNMNDEDLHELFAITDILVSDFSSIIFDFSLLEKPIYSFVPDLHEYLENRGCFVDYQELMNGCIAGNEEELAELIRKGNTEIAQTIRTSYLDYVDGNGLLKTMDLIEKIMD